MPVADTKRVQDLVNLAAIEIQAIRASVARLKDLRTKFLAAAPSTTGTPLAGNTTALNTALNNLDTAAAVAIWDTLIAGYVPTHQIGALDVT